MKHGDIVGYQSDNDTEIGTVIETTENMVTVTYLTKPDMNRAISKDRILKVIKEKGD